MAFETYVHAGNGTWRNLDSLYVHAGNGTWRDLDRLYVHAGNGNWRKIFDKVAVPSLDSATLQRLDEVTPCSGSSCRSCLSWDHTDCNNAYHHVATKVSLAGGGFNEWSDNLTCGKLRDVACSGCASKEGHEFYTVCRQNTQSQQWQIRIEHDGSDTLADDIGTCAASACCRETATISNCPGCVE
jgi:hypothetical protein